MFTGLVNWIGVEGKQALEGTGFRSQRTGINSEGPEQGRDARHTGGTHKFLLNEGWKEKREGRRGKPRTRKKCMCDGGLCGRSWRGAGLRSVGTGTHKGSVKAAVPKLAAQ